MSAVRSSDVLVLGGGLMGTTTAFFLRRQHGLSVTLLERELVAARRAARTSATCGARAARSSRCRSRTAPAPSGAV